MGSGKTTLALQAVENAPRLIIYTPGSSNKKLNEIPYIYDTPEYMRSWQEWLRRYPRLRIEKRESPTTIFRLLSNVRGCSILLDEVVALKTEPQERTDFEAFCRTIRYNGNQLVITTHRVQKDLPRLLHVIGTSFYWVGPGIRHEQELKTMYGLTNYPITYDDFVDGIERCNYFESFPIRMAE